MLFQQLNSIKKIKNFLDNYKKKKFSPNYDSPFYFASYSQAIGNLYLKKINGTNLSTFYKSKIIFKDLLYNLYYGNPKVVFNKNIDFSKFKKIIITWAYKKQFKKNGVFVDRYLNIKSNSSADTLWFVIYMSNNLPSQKSSNVVIFQPKYKKKKYFFFFIKKLFKSFKQIKFGTSYYVNSLSSHNILAEKILYNFKKFIREETKLIFFQYEGQPFQNEIIKYIKDNHSNIKITGYIHSPPLGLPANFIKKYYSPDKIIVNGSEQKNCFINLLGWKKQDIDYLPSRRFLKNSIKLSNFIFFPLTYNSEKSIIDSFQYLIFKKKLNLSQFKVKIHPGSLSSSKHRLFKKKLYDIINYSNKKNYIIPRSTSIFIGASGAIIEALEKNINIFHICEDVISEKFSQEIWKTIKVKIINNNIFQYSLLKKSSLIKFGTKKDKISNYFRI